MVQDTYEGIRAELEQLEEERHAYEKVEREMQQSEEDRAYQEQWLLQYNQDRRMYWQNDGEMQILLQKQQDIFSQMQQKRNQFMAEEADHTQKKKQYFEEKESEYYTRMKRFDMKETEE